MVIGYRLTQELLLPEDRPGPDVHEVGHLGGGETRGSPGAIWGQLPEARVQEPGREAQHVGQPLRHKNDHW